MNIHIEPRKVCGTISVPASKSISQRAFAAALLHRGQTIISNAGHSEDELAALKIVQQLGAQITQEANKLLITSDATNNSIANYIDCGESGLAARLFTPIAALYNTPIQVRGRGSLVQRPMHFFASVLESLQVHFPHFEGHVPFTLCGPLKPQNILVDGSLSSQFISGLLFAYSFSAQEKLQIEVDHLVSKPYIDLSLAVLHHFGKPIEQTNYRIFTIDPALYPKTAQNSSIHIEGDWSSAAFWMAAAAINGCVRLSGLKRESLQADKKMLEILALVGSEISWEKEILCIQSGEKRAFDVDLSDCPDLFPVLAILASRCYGNSQLKGLHRLIHKESNRQESIISLLTQLKVTYAIQGDILVISGQDFFPAIQYTCPKDHRMAMAAALAALNAEGSSQIENAESVNKSYPDFWNALDHIR